MGALTGRNGPGDSDRAQVHLDVVAPEDWEDLRSVRLRALADAPKAFVSEPGQEASWLEEDWRSVIQQAHWVVARTAHDVIGVARSSQDTESSDRRYIGAVWVAPEFRRLGIGGRLVRWLIDRERSSEIREILLWVIKSNDLARAFYLKLGFRSTGRTQPIERDPEPDHTGRAHSEVEELLVYAIGTWGFR